MARTNLRRVLRELRGRAWQAELGEALRPIADLFDAWRRGEASAFDLSDAIHRFHQGDSGEIWKRYQWNDTEMLVAEALEDGYLRRGQIPDAVYAHLLPHLECLRTMRTMRERMDEAPRAGEDAD
jgi:hypothetical protein